MQILILSDIHGNLSALEAVHNDSKKKYTLEKMLILGDIIDYGMRSNEVISMLKQIDIPIETNIWGNHEYAIMQQDYSRFSSQRGVDCAKTTFERLTCESRDYILHDMDSEGKKEISIDGKRCLLVHGSIDDCYWKSITIEQLEEDYKKYDYVFSGHSHIPYYFEKFYKSDAPETRGKKRTVFVNPGSVGQPRNLNPRAQYVVWNTDTNIVFLESVEYDIALEQSLFDGSVDDFYRERLKRGI